MKKYLLILPIAMALSGCMGSGKTTVLDAPTERLAAHTFKLAEGKSTVGADLDIKRQFEQEVKNGLKESNMTEGGDLIIEYRFIQFDEGSRFVRYLVGGMGNAGEGEMTVEVLFKNQNNKELGRIHVGGKITAGVFGGSFDHAIEQAAGQVVKYAITNFKG